MKPKLSSKTIEAIDEENSRGVEKVKISLLNI
jgi:hypothetical protein